MQMQVMTLNDHISLYFHPRDRECADAIEAMSVNAVRFLTTHFSLPHPRHIRLYVMNSWLHFLFHSASWPYKLAMGMFFPLVATKARNMWQYAAGWNMPYKHCPAVGIKPPRLLPQTSSSIGTLLFHEVPQPYEKIQHTTCHELTHALTSHLKLPMWLNEGLAMLAVERFFEIQSIRRDTLQLLTAHASDKTLDYHQLKLDEQHNTAAQMARGYWLTRYLEEKHPPTLRRLLAAPMNSDTIDAIVAAAAGLPTSPSSQQLDSFLQQYFA